MHGSTARRAPRGDETNGEKRLEKVQVQVQVQGPRRRARVATAPRPRQKEN